MMLTRTKILISGGVIVVAAAGGAAAGLAVGSHPVASQALAQAAHPVTLTCGSVPGTSTTGATIGDEAEMLGADNTAIGGNWASAEAAAAGQVSPTAAQRKAVNDLMRALPDFSTAIGARGVFASEVSTVYYAASHLTNRTPGWPLQSPVLDSDLWALASQCQAIG